MLDAAWHLRAPALAGLDAPTIAAESSALVLGTMIPVTGANVFADVTTVEVIVAGSVAVTASFGGEENHIFLLVTEATRYKGGRYFGRRQSACSGRVDCGRSPMYAGREDDRC
uniref:Retrovirus-related Pol polyprotein from transposon TNT 1-94 n=1 Tax=Tanacetum cinerariifolium TaxID=118510 RepID=A0A699GG02_TANCI|nr:retrovirus-related Pol polyprotein from transposon TNT 1-94 [Tanacetum cinerariifolium]